MKNKISSNEVKKGMTMSQVTGIRPEAIREYFENKKQKLAEREERSRKLIRRDIESSKK